MTGLGRLSGLVVSGYLFCVTPAGADPVLDWNAIASQAISTAQAAGRPGQVGAFDFVLVHIAAHDAVQAIEKRFEPYHAMIPGASGSPAAAVAKAAHDVLLSLFPTQAAFLNQSYDNYLAVRFRRATTTAIHARLAIRTGNRS
jgi:hypothetical protein